MSERAETSEWGKKARYGEFEIVTTGDNKPRLLGEGSFGKTYEAVRTDTVAGGVIKENVAVKVLNPELLISESRRFQFIQELVALTKFKHSNLIHYIRCGEDEGEVYYAMELCRGGDLTRLVRRYRVLPEKVAALIGLQVATGLREVHQRHRLVHRDIKPSNIMLVDELEAGLGVQHLAQRLEEQEGLCRIVDFGLVNFALNLKEDQQRFVGSPMYASPEQISEQAVDGRSDIYSLGMTLWFLVQGKGPLLDANGNDLKGVREAMRRHTNPDEHEASLPPHLSPEFRRILAKMVAKRPEERFATAAELQQVLREYLNTVAVHDEAKFTVTRLAEPLESAYALEETLPCRAAQRCWAARQKSTGERVKLSVMQDATDGPETEILAQQLCTMAELSRQPARLETLLRVREVIWAEDVIAFTEEFPPHVTLAEAMSAHQKARKPVTFPEAVALLRPVADALDFLIEHGQHSISLRGDEVWLTKGSQNIDPVADWQDLQIRFSMMRLPESGGEDVSLISSLQETVSGSLQISELNRHPVPAFARLVYFIMSGAEVAAATQFTPTAYVPAANLGAGSNNLIRDLLCGKNAWTHATAVLKDLCTHEEVGWQSLPPPVTAHISTGAGGTNPTDAGSSAAHAPSFTRSSQAEASSRRTSGAEKVCEIIGPGMVCSPYDPERRPQEVPAHFWVPSGRVTCQITQKVFRLPRKLDLLLARVVAPGMIQSPYAAPEITQAVPWEDWVAGAEIVCAESGRRIALPQGLPAPEGIMPPMRTGVIISPFDRVTAVAIPPERWEPGAGVLCPVTQSPFVLPKVLPPLEALADAGRPGTVATPYAPTMSWTLDPVDWVAGREVRCPMSGKPLRLPAMVERWPVEARVLDVSRRLVSNPYRPDTTVQVSGVMWRPSASIPCPQTGRAILLPASLPPLEGEVFENRPGLVHSPYSDEEIQVAPKDWVGGAAMVCPLTQLKFVLPNRLPEWIPTGSISGLPPGKVWNPYENGVEMGIKPDQWWPNQMLKCPTTGRPFRLPMELPALEARLKPGFPGKVISPFSGETQDVPLDDWKPGQRLECAKSGRTFRLPDIVEDWQADGDWVPGIPGRIRSPFYPHPEVDLTPEQWRPKQVLTCPATKRAFRAPITNSFPSLELERDAMNYALAEPEATEVEAAAALHRRHRAVNPKQVRAIWERHDLDTLAKRLRTVQVAENVNGEPGVVRSPYGSNSRVEVPPSLWLEPGAHMQCPETGRRFLLPAKRPPLLAQLVPGELGALISPYKPEDPFQIPPEQWHAGRMIHCEHTGHPLRLPASLPEWVPLGTVQLDQPGVVYSPYGARTPVRVPGSNWYSGAQITCLETRRVFALPENLPPLTGAVADGAIGHVYSPYAGDRKLRVPYHAWKPGARVTCPETKRVFLLPERLPVWTRKQFPWKAVAALAACAVLVGAILLALPGVIKAVKEIKRPEISKTPTDDSPEREPDPPPPPETPRPTTPPPVIKPQPPRVTFVGGIDIEDWPKKKEPPKSLRLAYRGKEIPLAFENNQLVATLPADSLDSPSGDEIELRLPGWKSVKVEVEKAAESQKFRTQSTSLLQSAEFGSETENAWVVKNPKRLERQRNSLPATIIPEAGTDYDFLEAKWVEHLPNEPDVIAPPVNPVRLRIAKGEIERALPTGIYNFTLRAESSDKVTILPHTWLEGVAVSSKPLNLYQQLPASMAGEYLGLVFTVNDKAQKIERGFFYAVSVGPKSRSIKAVVNSLIIKEGEIVRFDSIKSDKDELGLIENAQLTDAGTLEFDAPLKIFDYHWTINVERDGARYMYGKLQEIKKERITQEKMRLENMFREKARSGPAAMPADWLSRIPLEQYRILYEEYSKEAKQKEKALSDSYPDMKVKGSSFYFGLHPRNDAVRIIQQKNGDWDLQKEKR